MGIADWNAGIIRPVPVAPAGPFEDGAAKGVWTLDQMAFWLKQGLWPIAGNAAPVGLFGGGWNGSTQYNVIDKINIASAANATDFGDLNLSGRGVCGVSSSTRGVFAGFYTTASQNNIDYVTFASAGNATDFGDLTSARTYLAGCSNAVRGCFMAGLTTVGVNIIDYITIASAGNATDFGDTVRPTGGSNVGQSYGGAGCGSSTRGILFTGFDAGNAIQYITIASTGNAISFGDIANSLGSNQFYKGAAASDTRALAAGGYNNINNIDYITIATTGNSTDFGDLTIAVQQLAGCASSTRGVFGGGAGSVYENTVSYVTIASVGNATDFGDLTVARSFLGACSSATAAVQPTPTSAAIGMFLGGSLAGSNSYQITYVNIATTGNAYMWGSLASPYNPANGPTAVASSTRAVVGGGSTTAEGNTNTIQYLTFSTFGDASDFGDLLSRTINMTSLSDSTRGIFAGGEPSAGGRQNVIEYITIASIGNSTDFGDLTQRVEGPASCSSTTRGIIAGGVRYLASETNAIGYITIASTGNATAFGDLTVARNYFNCGGSSGTRGIFAGGQLAQSSASSSNVVDYVTIASTGNATDFGDITVARQACTTTSSTIRAITSGGSTGSTNYNIIDYVTIASTGNSIDFGDLVETIRYFASCSNAHGGL